MAAPSAMLADRVIKPAPGAGFDLYIFTMYEKPGWQPRTAGDRIRVFHPGTAISFDNGLYEIMEVGPATGTPYTFRYALRKWEDRNVVRQIVAYSAEVARAVGEQVEGQRRQYRRHSWMIYLFPLTGLLPTPLLENWRREWGLPMRGASIASTVLFGLVSLNLTAYVLSRKAETPAWFPLVLFVAIEQIIRLFWLIGAWQGAVGSLSITAAWGLFNVLRGLQPDGTPKRRRLKEYLAGRDEIRRLKDQPWDIEVRGAFRVPALLGDEPVKFEDGVYQPLGYEQQGQGLSRRYVFRLKQLDGGRKAAREYNPERSASQVAALIPYERSRDSVHAWALLCGYLPAVRQLELERLYDYDSSRATERAAILMLVAAGLQLSTVLVRPLGLGHLVAMYLVAESAYRLALARARGEPTGSVFGWFLYPFLRF